jgi:hypothetical protein
MENMDIQTVSTTYKGHVIRPIPLQRKDTNEWTTNVLIMRSAGTLEFVNRYFSNNTFPTREKAQDMCVELARQIIDGEIGIDPP